MTFFDYESPYRTGNFISLTTTEYVVPFIILALLVGALLYYRDYLRQHVLMQQRLERIVGVVFLVVYVSHYLLRFNLYRFDTIILPFQLCGISMMFAIYLLFSGNKNVYAFVLYTGVLGGLTSLFTPIMGYDSAYYRYYQFYGAHILLILTPIYYMVVKSYYPTAKSTVNAFLILQGLALFMGVFNYFYHTDFMFIFVDPVKETKFPMIKKFGGVPYYIIWMELVGLAGFYLMYKVTTLIEQYRVQQVEYQNQ
ncbi:TIGR02206 family membrane protein [Candidatus Xianfuyuplasma coldseepsis]|uniref:TIGR02206 family membrane protein n=1 Tax=Candidatus Xianfuyuplasma coldseepsis TaxID=2782163 RepID=A0A7L7KSC6_9MOLU|nr:TIGR02206 family membrane protein [Xianfuyuplasma coldseepsis]QMS85721.1 TIGR02206 family membrane protein [Xianfuyuplasma coldseepsis]